MFNLRVFNLFLVLFSVQNLFGNPTPHKVSTTGRQKTPSAHETRSLKTQDGPIDFSLLTTPKKQVSSPCQSPLFDSTKLSPNSKKIVDELKLMEEEIERENVLAQEMVQDLKDKFARHMCEMEKDECLFLLGKEQLFDHAVKLETGKEERARLKKEKQHRSFAESFLKENYIQRQVLFNQKVGQNQDLKLFLDETYPTALSIFSGKTKKEFLLKPLLHYALLNLKLFFANKEDVKSQFHLELTHAFLVMFMVVELCSAIKFDQITQTELDQIAFLQDYLAFLNERPQKEKFQGVLKFKTLKTYVYLPTHLKEQFDALLLEKKLNGSRNNNFMKTFFSKGSARASQQAVTNFVSAVRKSKYFSWSIVLSSLFSLFPLKAQGLMFTKNVKNTLTYCICEKEFLSINFESIQ